MWNSLSAISTRTPSAIGIRAIALNISLVPLILEGHQVHHVAVLATKSFPIDEQTLREAIGTPVELMAIPEDCLRHGSLDDASMKRLCLATADAQAVVFRVGQVPQQVIETAPNLKIVAVHGVGTDAVAVPTATKRGVYVTVAPGGNTVAVAEYVICVSLLAKRRLDKAASLLRSGTWKEPHSEGEELFGKRIGIVGLGAIGSRIAQLADAFGMEILVADYAKLPNCRYRTLPLPSLAQVVDYLVVTVPFRPSTKGLISEKIIRAMRPSARCNTTKRSCKITCKCT